MAHPIAGVQIVEVCSSECYSCLMFFSYVCVGVFVFVCVCVWLLLWLLSLFSLLSWFLFFKARKPYAPTALTVQVGKPNLGEMRPSSVRADVTVNFSVP